MPIISDCMGLNMLYLNQPEHKEKHKIVEDALAVLQKYGLKFIVGRRGENGRNKNLYL